MSEISTNPALTSDFRSPTSDLRLPVSGLWLCLRSSPRREKLAAASVAGLAGVLDVFAPEVRVRRKTRRGAVWFVEALFPSYLFVCVDESVNKREMASVRGAVGVLRFGDSVASVDAGAIDSLRAVYDHREVLEIDQPLEPGELAEVVTGPFRGFIATIMECRKSSDRVAVLVELMGREVHATMHRDHLDAMEKKFSFHPLAASG